MYGRGQFHGDEPVGICGKQNGTKDLKDKLFTADVTDQMLFLSLQTSTIFDIKKQKIKAYS